MKAYLKQDMQVSKYALCK